MTEGEHQTAIHEAGHAVACVVLDREFVRVTLDGPDWMRGGIMYPQPERGPYQFGDLDSPEKMQKHLRVAFAGRAAEEVFGFTPDPGASANDYQQASRLAQILTDSAREYNALCDRALDEVDDLIEQNRETVEAVATALLERRDLTQEDVRELVSE